MTSIHTINAGDKVTGFYLGQPFTGVVTSHRPHTMNHRIELFFVDLDSPVTVFGDERTSLLVDASDQEDALAHYLGHPVTGATRQSIQRVAEAK